MDRQLVSPLPHPTYKPNSNICAQRERRTDPRLNHETLSLHRILRGDGKMILWDIESRGMTPITCHACMDRTSTHRNSGFPKRSRVRSCSVGLCARSLQSLFKMAPPSCFHRAPLTTFLNVVLQSMASPISGSVIVVYHFRCPWVL